MLLPAIFFSCKGEEGDIGPSGTVGPQGDPGPKAINKKFSLEFGPDIFDLYNGFLNEPEENDALFVYWRQTNYSGVDFYTQLPFRDDSLFVYQQTGDNGQIFVFVENPDGSHTYPDALPSPVTLDFKAILIKGQAGKRSDVNYKDYHAVCRHYGLEP